MGSPLDASGEEGTAWQEGTEGRRRVAHYRLGDRLGMGGMSEISRVWDERTGQQVAIKLLQLPRFVGSKTLRPGGRTSFQAAP